MSLLKKVREARGRDPSDLAARLKIGVPWYFDLESDRAGWTSEISVGAFRRLAQELEVTPGVLLSKNPTVVLTPEDFVGRLLEYLAANEMTTAEASQKTGWDVEGLINDPSSVAKLNLDGLRAICDEVGLDWLSVLDAMRTE